MKNREKRQWLFDEKGGQLFHGDAAIEKAIKDGFVDSPAKVSVITVDPTDPTNLIESVDPVDTAKDIFKTMTVDELRETYTVGELKKMCKDSDITGMSRKSERECAEAIFNKFNNPEGE